MNREEKIEKLISFAKKFIGKPYKYGARMEEAPDFFDCSSFVKYVFAHIGIELPRSSIDQASFTGRRILDSRKIKGGDLVFLRGERGHYNKKFPNGIGHVVLYIGDGKVIHASSKRIVEHPKIKERGSVRVDTLKNVIKRGICITAIKRIIY